MIRLTLILAIVIVVAMIVLPPDDPVVDQSASDVVCGRPSGPVAADRRCADRDADGGLVLVTADG
jgi:hypothetical protein